MPVTANTLLNWYTFQWDMFLEAFEDKHDQLVCLAPNWLFRASSQDSYVLFRNVSQLLDLCILDSQALRFSSQSLALACIKASLALNIDGIKSVEMLKGSVDVSDLNEVFDDFIGQATNLDEIQAEVEFVYRFLEFDFSYVLPITLQANEDNEVYS